MVTIKERMRAIVAIDAITPWQVLDVGAVEDLRLGRNWPEEIERSTAGKDFDVALVGREKWNQPVGEPALSADPGDDW